MPKTIKYTGTRERWPELATTGKQSVWMPGQTEERGDAEANQLLSTGQFTEVFALDDLPLPSLVSGAGTQIVNAGTAGSDSGWVVYTPGMRLAYALDSGSTSTTFSVDISADGSVSLGQAFSGTWNSTTAEVSPPIYLSNPQARYIRFNVLTGGPLSVIRF